MITRNIDRLPREYQYALFLTKKTDLRPVGRVYYIEGVCLPEGTMSVVPIGSDGLSVRSEACTRSFTEVRFICDSYSEARLVADFAKASLPRRYEQKKALEAQQRAEWDAALKIIVSEVQS